MIDIHSHIIPGVDDGAESLEITVSLVDRAREQGATTFFATSHSYAFLESGKNANARYEKMKTVLQNLFPDVQIYLGCEILCTRENMETIIQKLNGGILPAMNNTRYVLTEFYGEASLDTIRFCASALLTEKWIPIIAHTERYSALRNRSDEVDCLRKLGCQIQLNVYALESDNPNRDWARQLVLEKKVDYLGTDMHGYWVRVPSITQGMDWLEENCDREYLDAVAWKNARDRLIMAQEITSKDNAG